ncbi:MAG: hemerythrin HHE cation-binding protein [Erythrobacter sp. 34-65-8]|nr:MAG: hemerythrin HHE cation-binding protein [Erythrobacter sp. 34-65-8]
MSHCEAIFVRLKQDHDRHRALLKKIGSAGDDGEAKTGLFTELTKELKGHAAAEEQALYSTMMRKPPTTDETRHSVAEHHEIDEMLNDLAATDMASDEWMTKFRDLEHRYLHHIEEEEEEHFPDFAEHLTAEDEVHMTAVFDRRKKAEKAEAEVTPEKAEDAKE